MLASTTSTSFITNISSNYGVYNFYGVYAAPAFGDLFQGRTIIDTQLTLATCASYCGGSLYFAIQNGKLVYNYPSSLFAEFLSARNCLDFNRPAQQLRFLMQMMTFADKTR